MLPEPDDPPQPATSAAAPASPISAPPARIRNLAQPPDEGFAAFCMEPSGDHASWHNASAKTDRPEDHPAGDPLDGGDFFFFGDPER